MSWLAFKIFAKKSWLWLKTYWYFPVVLLYTLVLWVFFRKDSAAAIGVLEIRSDSYDKQINVINKTHKAEVKKKEELAEQVLTCQIRLASAMKLIKGLGGEEIRWRENVEKLSTDFVNLDGDMIIASGSIAYLGAFTADFRDAIVKVWVEKVLEKKIRTQSIGTTK